MYTASNEPGQRSLTVSAPGPRGNFLFGNMFDFQRDPLAFLRQVADQFGDVAHYRIANINFYQVNHPDGIQRVLQENNHNYIKGDYWDIIRQVGGLGLFTSEGSLWLRQRRLMQPGFHRQRIAGFAEIMTGRTLQMLEGWEKAAQAGKAIDISHEFTDLTMKIITEAMFGTRLDEETTAITEAITLLLDDMNFRFEVPFYPGFGVPTLRNRRALAALKVVDSVVYGFIEKRRKSGEQKDDLLGMLMAARDEETGQAMPDKQLRDEVVTIFVAGHETTAVLMTWLFQILAQQPEWEQRLAAETNGVLNGRLPGFGDAAAFPTLRLAIDETLRLYPPVWMTNRVAVAEDVVCGKRIPSGAIVGIPAYVIHRLPAYWPDPERFDPYRFTPENSANRPRYAYLPFGGGPHQCIGNNFALLEAQMIYATIAQRYRLQLQSNHAQALKPSLTLRPQHEVWMKVERR